jgi:hypothetical protein
MPDNDEKKPSLFTRAIDSVLSAPSRFYDHMVESGRRSMEEAKERDRVAQGLTPEQQKERDAQSWRNNSVHTLNKPGGPGMKP